MNSMILGLLAETSIHPGAGQSAGFVDLPVAREAATDYPVIVGSSMKGALRDMARRSERLGEPELRRVFGAGLINGQESSAGDLLVSDARLLLLPVRSLKSHYKWVTCPHLIERLQRDQARQSGASLRDAEVRATLSDHQYLGAGTDDEDLYLEEREFKRLDGLPPGLIELIKPLIAHEPTAGRLASQLVVISDKDFVWFARYGLAVNARNQLHDTKKTSENLWYEETIPPDAVFYCLLAERSEGALTAARSLFQDRPYLQVGGNETVGQGWFAVKIVSEPNQQKREERAE